MIQASHNQIPQHSFFIPHLLKFLKCSYANAVAFLPLGVRSINPF